MYVVHFFYVVSIIMIPTPAAKVVMSVHFCASKSNHHVVIEKHHNLRVPHCC